MARKLVADRGYESSAFRRALRRRGIRSDTAGGRPVVARKEDYRLTYTVERSVAWLGSFRRLLLRWEHYFEVYRSFFLLALLVICVRARWPDLRTLRR